MLLSISILGGPESRPCHAQENTGTTVDLSLLVWEELTKSCSIMSYLHNLKGYIIVN